MAKQRFTIPGGSKFQHYDDAKRFKDQHLEILDAFDPNSEDQVQIRKYSGGFKIVVRREVGS